MQLFQKKRRTKCGRSLLSAGYLDQVKCSMLMIQGRNDPRVVERETADVVERLRTRGVPVDYLVFEDEGHDVIKLKNRVTCYNRITSFFTQHLKAE
jgi:dipeptidyl aminopeptidase/acylaminoacyl peptidase